METDNEQLAAKITRMNIESSLIQPDLLPKEQNEKDRAVQVIIDDCYSRLCAVDATFSISVLMDEGDPRTLFRICECKKLEDHPRFDGLAWRLCCKMMDFLDWFGYFKILAEKQKGL